MFRRILKVTLISLGALVLLVVAASLSLHILIQRQDHQFIKDQLSHRIAEATGYTLQINGPLELPYALLPTVVLNDIVLDARAPVDDATLLSADSLRVTIAILPLLDKRLRIDDTTLTNANLCLEFDATGQANWIPENPPDAGESDTVVDVHAINFEQLDIRFVDQRIDVEVDAQISELRLDAPADETFVDVTLEAEFEDLPIRAEGRISARDNAFAGLELPISLTGSILDMDFAIDGHVDRVVGAPIDELGFFAKVQLEGGDMDAFSEITGLPLPTTSSFLIDGDVEGHPGAIVASDVDGVLEKEGLTLVAKGRISQLTSFDELDLAATLEGDDLQSVPYFDPGELPATDSFNATARVLGDWPSLSLEDVVVTATREDISVAASGQLADASTFGGADLDIRIAGDNLSGLAAIFDLPPVETRSYQGSGKLRGSWPRLSVANADISLARNNLSMRVSGDAGDVLGVSGLKLNVEAQGNDLAVIPELEPLDLPRTDSFTFSGDMAGNLEHLSARNTTTTVKRGNHEVTASGAVAGIGTFSGIDMIVSASGTDLYELNDVFAPDFPHTEKYTITGTLGGDFDNLSASDLNLEGSVPGIDLNVSGNIGKIIELRDVDVHGEIRLHNPSEFGEWSGINLPGDIEIKLSGHMAGTAPNFDLSDLTYSSGESLVHGNAKMIVGDKLSFSGAVTSGKLDVRPFLIAAREETPETQEEADDRFFSDAPFDFSYLDAVDLDFSLDDLELVRTGEYARIPRARISVQQGSLKIDPMEVVRGDMRLKGHLHLDRTAKPLIDADLGLENVDLSAFLEDVRFRDFYEGSFDFALDVSAQGGSVSEMASNLDGDLAIFISDASIAGVDVRLRITDVLLGALPWIKRTDDVYINCAMSEMVAEDGIVDVRVIYLDAQQLRMVGGGTIDLRNETYDLRLEPRPRGTRIFAHNVDVLVKGSIMNPEYAISGAAKTVATKYGKYVLLGPAGLLVPTGRSKKHPCSGSLQEYRQSQDDSE